VDGSEQWQVYILLFLTFMFYICISSMYYVYVVYASFFAKTEKSLINNTSLFPPAAQMLGCTQKICELTMIIVN